MRRGVKDILEGTGPIRVPKWAMDLYEDIFDDPERDRYYEETDYERLLTIAYAIQWKHPELRLGQTIYVFLISRAEQNQLPIEIDPYNRDANISKCLNWIIRRRKENVATFGKAQP